MSIKLKYTQDRPQAFNSKLLFLMEINVMSIRPSYTLARPWAFHTLVVVFYGNAISIWAKLRVSQAMGIYFMLFCSFLRKCHVHRPSKLRASQVVSSLRSFWWKHHAHQTKLRASQTITISCSVINYFSRVRLLFDKNAWTAFLARLSM